MGKYQKNIEAARRITVMQYLETYHPGELVRKTDCEYCTRTHDMYPFVNRRKHSLIAIADKIVRCIRHRVFFIKKFCNMKAADIHIKMDISLIKVRRTGFPYFRVRIPEPKLPSEAVVMFDQAL